MSVVMQFNTYTYTLPVLLFYYCFIFMNAEPSWSFSLQALYSAFWPYQPLGSTLSLWASSLHRQSNYLPCLYVCLCGTNILCRFSCIAHFLGWLPNMFYFLHPLGFVRLPGVHLDLMVSLHRIGRSDLMVSLHRFGCSDHQVFQPSQQASLALNALSLTPSKCSYAIDAASS